MTRAKRASSSTRATTKTKATSTKLPPNPPTTNGTSTTTNNNSSKALNKNRVAVQEKPPPPPSSRKRGIPKAVEAAQAALSGSPAKRSRGLSSEKAVPLSLHSLSDPGSVLSVGQGDTGQLGLGEDILERSKPGVVSSVDNVVDIVAGGMHSLALSSDGRLYSFGCNDEGSLGRETPTEEDAFRPGVIDIPEGKKIVMASAGDSHSVCLSEDGKAFYWGTFRDSSGSFGLTPAGEIEKKPLPLAPELEIKKISSGADHIALLTTKGEIFTLGNAEQGQLGRIGERFTKRGGRRGTSLLLQPSPIHSSKRKTVFKDVWAGSYNTFALTEDNEVLVCGLNNYSQLGLQTSSSVLFSLIKSESLCKQNWRKITLGQHHTLALDHDGKVYSWGRKEYGRLGLGQSCDDAVVPTHIQTLDKVVDVSCGSAVSFAVTESGECFSWGMGNNGQLAQGGEDDAWSPGRVIGKQLENRKVILAAGGGQHTLLLAK